MRVNEIKRLLRSALPNAPQGPQAAWIDTLLDHFNSAVEAALRALQGQLTVGDNLQGRYLDLDIRTRSDYGTGGWDTVRATIPFRARAAMIAQLVQVESVYTPVTEALGVSWRQDGETLLVEWVAGLAASKRYNLRLLVLP
jgi:hypothetical protein